MTRKRVSFMAASKKRSKSRSKPRARYSQGAKITYTKDYQIFKWPNGKITVVKRKNR